MNEKSYSEKLEAFRALVQQHQLERAAAQGYTGPGFAGHFDAKIKNGSKFDKVDVGTSGKYMVEARTGNIFGIKGYGVVHRGHWYGTLDTTGEYFWGNFYPEKLDGSLGKQKANGCPAITVAPRTFADNQADLTLDDVKVLWCGARVEVYQNINGCDLGKFLTSFSADNAVEKLQRWCVKNNVRCSQVVDGRILL